MFRWGILGTGPVARKFVLGLRAAQGMQAVIVASRNPANAERFARELGVAKSASYEQAVEAEADAFYIATPPSEHRAHALLCLARRRPVLIEKPFAASAEDAAAIIAAAREARTFAMEAMWTRFLPAVRRIKALVDDGAIGAPRQFAGAFCAADVPDAGKNLFNPAMGGGALLHRGVYPLSLAWHLFGPVAGMTGAGRIGATGVDEDAALVATHANGALSSIRASLVATAPLDFTLAGTAGEIRVAGPIFRPFRFSLHRATPRAGGMAGSGGRMEALKEGALLQGAQQRLDFAVRALRGGGRGETHAYGGNGYHHQAEEVARCIAAGLAESPLMKLDESLAIVAAIERARAGFSA